MTAAGGRRYRLRDSFGALSEEVELSYPLWEGNTIRARGRWWRVTNVCPPSLSGFTVVNVEDRGPVEPPRPPARRYVVGSTGEELRQLRVMDWEGLIPHRPGDPIAVGPRRYRVAAVEEDGGLVLLEPEGATHRPRPGPEWPGQRYVDRRTGRELEDLRNADAVIAHRVGKLLVHRGVRYRVATVDDDGDTVLVERE